MAVKIQTIKDIRSFLSQEINDIFPPEEIWAMSNIIVRDVLGISDIERLRDHDKLLSEKEIVTIQNIASELKTGKPIQYILGEAPFYGLTFKVTPDTLIPRQETEELVRHIITENASLEGDILDIGTGTGCIAIALSVNMQKANLFASDFSREALEVAQINAQKNNVKVTFIHDDILNTSIDGSFDIIVSNPPYVLESEKRMMSINVVNFEPPTALYVPDDKPLLFYEKIAEFASEHLKEKGKLYFEINEAFGPQVAEMMRSKGFQKVRIIKDINGKDRFAEGETITHLDSEHV
ncbi:MAG: peptide chain release factor N(5)-glutamine methyltransferase [Bacteroidales bacterium]|nr:peptide chain release factor N(5)-glutamine methyltransferase [Bacteroidales bacterium]